MKKLKYQEGNIVNHYYDGDEYEQVTVVGQVYDRVHIQLPTGGGTDVDIKTIEPIALTLELLLKCGFKLHQNGLYVNNDIWIELKGVFTPVYSDGSSFRRYIGKHLKHLHQLQNFYFALTGEEIAITSPLVL